MEAAPASRCAEPGRDGARRVEVQRERADVLDDGQRRPSSKVAVRDLGISCGRVRARGSARATGARRRRARPVPGSRPRRGASRTRATRAPRIHFADSIETPSVAAEPDTRRTWRLRTHGADVTPVPARGSGDGGEAAVRGVEDRADHRVGLRVRAHDRRAETSCSVGGSTNTTVTIATSCAPTRTICALSTSMHSAAVSSWRSASTVAVATRRWRAVEAIDPSANPTASLSPRARVTRTRERRPLTSAVVLTSDRTEPEVDRLDRLGVPVAVGGAPELHDRDDAAVELDPEAAPGRPTGRRGRPASRAWPCRRGCGPRWGAPRSRSRPGPQRSPGAGRAPVRAPGPRPRPRPSRPASRTLALPRCSPDRP